MAPVVALFTIRKQRTVLIPVVYCLIPWVAM